ncbi:hypothetical protein L249_2750 [Ophiocordyceps polyrhachis-furcata BCC 54312]|uniref:RING-type domain-containing protein n=1 Tax=Ophiocordyceps polyrhachis-furcata BCC 54312 TaxID=1330021 RepID=A0A367LMT7_9HYPO|nr:hypothetical protein L249_2750 [Ophiocordyceps polyrhachis-furcata BCC 54312]
MATQYEVEHNVELSAPRRSTRRVDMASFFSLINTIDSTPGTNPHATPTPFDASALFRLLRDQLRSLHETAPTEGNRDFLEQLMESLDDDIHDPPARLSGASQQFVDSLDRVPRKRLARDDDCAICKLPYLDDEWCLVVELPCKGRHRFDLECVAPWLRSKGTCPMCRERVGDAAAKTKPVPVDDDDDDEEDGTDMMYS